MNSINNRIKKGIKPGFWNATTTLKDFVIITYLVDYDKLRKHIPSNFELVTVKENGIDKAIISAVPFLDEDFYIKRFFPFIKFKFYQTNYRAYVIDKKTGEHLVWFFGTNLGSSIVNIPRLFWKIPWYSAKYKDFSESNNYNLSIQSNFNSGGIQFLKTNEPIQLLKEFKSMNEMMLILTHPIKGVYKKLNGKIGTYRIAHEKMNLKVGENKEMLISLFEDLNLLNKEEMNKPYAIFYLDQIRFDIELPPVDYK